MYNIVFWMQQGEVMKYFHSVTLDSEKCKGCTNCLKRCPTEAIRVRGGKAHIIAERCVDCGECIRTCPYHAKIATTDNISVISSFPYKIALPAPSLYGQFKNLNSIGSLLGGLVAMGFDWVYEVARGADIVSAQMRKLLVSDHDHPLPLISSACPAVVRLIQVRFPDLLPNVVDLLAPVEVAAKLAKEQFSKERGVPIEQIGAFFLTPCPAKMTSIRNPLGLEKSNVDGAISILEIYGLLSGQMRHPGEEFQGDRASFAGIGWANSGGESTAVGCDNALAVDGIHNVIRVLEQIEDNKLSDLQFFEGLACQGGCVGGALTFENAYVAKNRIRRLVEKMQQSTKPARPETPDMDIAFTRSLPEQPVLKLDDDIGRAMEMMEHIERLTEGFKGLDCGSCGAPTCRALAEDIVKGQAVELDCIFKLKEKVNNLARQMKDLSDMQ